MTQGESAFDAQFNLFGTNDTNLRSKDILEWWRVVRQVNETDSTVKCEYLGTEEYVARLYHEKIIKLDRERRSPTQEIQAHSLHPGM